MIAAILEGELVQNKWSCQVHKIIRRSNNISRLNDALHLAYTGKIYSPFPDNINIAIKHAIYGLLACRE